MAVQTRRTIVLVFFHLISHDLSNNFNVRSTFSNHFVMPFQIFKWEDYIAEKKKLFPSE